MDKDDFQIEIGQSVRRHIENKINPLKDGSLRALPYDQPDTDQIPVFVAESVMRAIEAHVRGDMDKEVGGVLLGGFYRGDEGSFIEVTDFIEARTAVGTDVSLTFTHETWEQINAEQSKRGPSAKIVGWYHSHPALGVFMSKEDEFIHSGYFTDPWHVAIVVDPVYHNWGCFKWHDGVLERTGGFYVFADKKSAKRVKEYTKTLNTTRQTAPRHASAAADRRDSSPGRTPGLLWAVVALLVISQLVMGWYLFVGRPDNYKIALEHLGAGDLSGGTRYLTLARSDNRALAELVRLNRVYNASDAGQERFDTINYMVYAAEKMARESHSGSVWDVRSIYESASGTYQERLQRAKQVRQILHGKRAGTGDWSDKALRQLRDEELWRMAYAKRCSQAIYEKSYRQEYERLARGERRRVDEMCRKLIDWYPSERNASGSK